jgi:hypothetical protein
MGDSDLFKAGAKYLRGNTAKINVIFYPENGVTYYSETLVAFY